jgi:hypothetical protein
VSEFCASGRLVRSFVHYLQQRVGEPAFGGLARQLPPSEASILAEPPSRADWIPLGTWQPILESFERRFGDLPTWRLVREATRSTMAVAISRGWSAFLADVTPERLLERADTFWRMSYNAGTLVVASRRPRHVVLAIEGWSSPPEPVAAMVAEACAVFLARLGERTPRAIERLVDGQAQIEVTW